MLMLVMVARGYSVIICWDLHDGELAVRLAKRQGIGELLGLYNVSIYISCRACGDLRGTRRLAQRR